jgi:hypothetical protein
VQRRCQHGPLDLLGRPPYRRGVDRRRLLLSALAGGLAAPLPARAEQATKTRTVGILTMAAGPSPIYGPVLLNALRDHGQTRRAADRATHEVRAARALGLAIPPSLLLQADQVIE